MTIRPKVRALALVSVLLAAGMGAPAVLQAISGPQETGPVYSLEGAWYGITTFDGGMIPPTPTLDTFTSNARRPGVEGTFLCTIPAQMAGGQSPSGHGNWARVGTNTYAFTAVRAIVDGETFVGWAKFWGIITPVSDDQLSGTINAQFYLPNGTPISPQFTGALERHRVAITYER